MATEHPITTSFGLSEPNKKVPRVFCNDTSRSSNIKNALFGMGQRKSDALEAVKLDPAVLEAQVTVHTKDNVPNTAELPHVAIEKNKEENTPPSTFKGFEEMVSQQEAALLSLSPHQLDLLMNFADVLRTQRRVVQKYMECAFCKNNGRPLFWYTSHSLKDGRGRVRCPVLRGYRCPRCGATGDLAHTIKYCPEKEA